MTISELNYYGIALGAVSFIIIGIFHPLVIKGEYYLGRRMCLIFLIMGVSASAGSLLVNNSFISANLGVFGFASFWGIKEVTAQIKRVEDGRFPKNPNRTYTNK